MADDKASEERYKQIVDFMPDAIFLHRDGKVIFMNPAGLKLFGFTDPKKIIGQSIWNLYPPERHGIVRARNQTMERTGGSVPLIEHVVLRNDGVRINVEAAACRIDYEGAPAIFVAFRDITERKRDRLLLDLQYAVSRSLIEAANLIDASKHVVEAICNDLKFDISKIWAFDKKDQVLRLVASWTLENGVDQEQDSSLAHKALETGQPYWLETAEGEYKLAIEVPIFSGKEILGVIECLNRVPLARDELIMQTLMGLSDQIDLFLKREKFEKDLSYIAKHDLITGLSNRTFFEEILTYELNLMKNKNKVLAVIFIDIDSFNAFNEAMGHAAGDELLQAIATRLLTLNIASENLGRFGPQFAIICSEVHMVEDVTKFINDINKIIAPEFMIEDQKLHIKFNYGIAMYPDDGAEASTLLRSASIALSSAKDVGGGAVQFCTIDLNLRAQVRVRLENDMRAALANDEFYLMYQPIVDANALIPIGFESLVRWNKNSKLVNPEEFISLAEKTHLIVPLGEWIMRAACAQCKIWQNVTDHPVSVSVNISPVQFKHGMVTEMIAAALKETQLDPTCLKIEVTESTLMDNTHRGINMLHAIKDMGVKISIDDFGVGYSSLNYLRHLPVDYLKVDQSFVRNMTVDAYDAAIVKTIIDLASNLHYQVIAEGVETQEQLNFLTTLGCFNIQGYYFSPPLSVDEATIFLQQGKLLR